MLLLISCAIPVNTKKELREKAFVESIKDTNYLILADYWDENSKKMTIDFKSAAYMKVNEPSGIIEITIGNGPYYGLIELHKIGEKKTRIRAYGWGGLESHIEDWVKLIKDYENPK